MITRLGTVGLLAALSSVLTLAPASAAADEGAYYRLLCDWSESSRASAGVTTPALPTGECATPAVSQAPPGLADLDDSGDSEEPESDGDPTNPLDSRELRNRFDLPPPDVAAGPAHGPIPQLPTVDRAPCDVPGSGCGSGGPSVTENPPVDLPPSVPGILEPPPSNCAGVPGCF